MKNFSLFVLCAFIAAVVIAVFFTPKRTDDTDHTTITFPSVNEQFEPENLGLPSAEYAKTFEDFGLYVHLGETPLVGLTSHRYVLNDTENECLCHYVYACDGDVIKKYTETYYYNVANLDEAEQAIILDSLRNSFQLYDDLNCCVVTYTIHNNDFLKVKVDVTDAYTSESLAELETAGLIKKVDTFGAISISATETSLLSQGFVKR